MPSSLVSSVEIRAVMIADEYCSGGVAERANIGSERLSEALLETRARKR